MEGVFLVEEIEKGGPVMQCRAQTNKNGNCDEIDSGRSDSFTREVDSVTVL
jgi:hypothetical protein